MRQRAVASAVASKVVVARRLRRPLDAVIGQAETLAEDRSVRLAPGLEHIGARLDRIDAGFGFVKLDAAVTAGAGLDPRCADCVRGSVEMPHNLSPKVSPTSPTRTPVGLRHQGHHRPWVSALRADAVN